MENTEGIKSVKYISPEIRMKTGPLKNVEQRSYSSLNLDRTNGQMGFSPKVG